MATNGLALARKYAWDLVTAHKAVDRGTAYRVALNHATGRSTDQDAIPDLEEWERESHLTADRAADQLARISVSAITCLATARHIRYDQAVEEVMQEVQAREDDERGR